jgi:hypothetical protein
MSATTISSATPLGSTLVNSLVAGFGDFNGDAMTDMMVRDATSGTCTVYDISKSSQTPRHPGQVVMSQRGRDVPLQQGEANLLMHQEPAALSHGNLRFYGLVRAHKPSLRPVER